MRPNILLILGFLLIFTEARADSPRQVWQHIQHQYNRANHAASQHDFNPMLELYAPQYIFITYAGKSHPISYVRFNISQLNSVAEQVRATSHIKKLTITGKVVTVIVSEAAVVTLPPRQGLPVTLTEQDISQDKWIKMGSQWRLIQSKQLSVKKMINGKPNKL